MRTWIAGMAPSRTSDPSRPLVGDSGRRLAKALGAPSLDALLARCAAVNLIGRWPGRLGRGDKFPLAEAREGAARLLAKVEPGDRVLLLGSGPARVVLGHRPAALEWVGGPRGARFALVPHPSGLNHWWNAPENRAAALTFGRELLAAEALAA